MKGKTSKFLIYSLLFIISLIMIFPMIWMFLLSLKSYPERFSNILQLISSDTTFVNFTDALSSDSFDIYFINSIIVAGFITLGNLLFSTMVGYALARKNFRGKSILTASILGVLIIPSHIV